MRECPKCKGKGIDKGRAFDGRRAYRCQSCQTIWTEGLQGGRPHFSKQREGFQFADSRRKLA